MVLYSLKGFSSFRKRKSNSKSAVENRATLEGTPDEATVSPEVTSQHEPSDAQQGSSTIDCGYKT